MQRYNQHTPFVVLEFDADVWEHPVHKHNHYEIIFINKGKGTHTINDVNFPYQEGDIFLLSPEDYHSFFIIERTSFCFFKFTELVFKKNKSDLSQRHWMERIEAIIILPNQIPGAICFDNSEKEYINSLCNLILKEHHSPHCYSSDIISDAMSTVISIIARNICYSYYSSNTNVRNNIPVNKEISEILTYIRHNVYEPQKVSLNSIAKKFGMSKNYVGSFFKKHTGETLQYYLVNYKLLLAENRIVNSSNSIQSIALDLGFTDLSHLNKLFKRKFGLMPGQYRKSKQALRNTQ